MNAHDLTAHGIASALLGKPRREQSVHVCKSLYGGYSIFGGSRDPRHLVMVDGQFFEVRTRTLRLLQSGEMTPDELGLDPMTEDEVEAFGKDA